MNDAKSVYVIGSGGHAKVVTSVLRALGHCVAAVFDDDSNRWGQSLCETLILGPVERIKDHPRRPAVIAIGNNAQRRIMVDRLPDLDWITVIHPSAHVDPSVRLGHGTVVMAGTVIQVDSVLGDHAIVNTAVSVDHDCILGDFTHIAPGSHLAGGVTVAEGAMVGIGAVVAPGVTIGPWPLVGAQAAVVRDLPPRVVAAGVPAQIKRHLDTANLGLAENTTLL